MTSLTVLTPSEALANIAAPTLQTVDQFSLAPEDWLIVCAGFEERALAVLENAIAIQSQFQVVLICYEPHVSENKADEIRTFCTQAGIPLVEAIYDRQAPAGFGDVLTACLSGCEGRIVVDISAMSRLLIVQILVALSARPRGFLDCCVAYAQAETYPPTREEAEAALARHEVNENYGILFLSSGVFEVSVVPELSSQAMGGEQTRLIAFPSLDAQHLISLRTELQPSRLSLIDGIPPDQTNQWRQEIISKLNHVEQLTSSGAADQFAASTLWYQETLKTLLQIYSQHSLRDRLLLAPTGSKMQSVAVGIFRSFVEDVQIVYPTPSSFLSPTKYTQGVGAFHWLPLSAFYFDHPKVIDPFLGDIDEPLIRHAGWSSQGAAS